MRILAIDPGEINGWCLLEKYNLLEYGQGNKNDLIDRVKKFDYEYLIVERFIILPGTFSAVVLRNLRVVEIIGIIKEIIKDKNIKYIEQIPACKKFFDSRKLKKMGYKIKGKHSKDALRHVLYFLKFKMNMENKNASYN